jgi:drug/metabolite transporter (DMT)-like permease
MVTTRDACPRRASLKKTIAILIVTIFAQATGNVFLSMKMKEIGGNGWLIFLARAIESPTFWFGTALLMVSFIFFATALSWADLSFVVPAVSAEVVVNVVFANYFLSEVVSLTRWMGVLFISVGVILVLRSERQKAHRKSKEILTGVDR